MVAFLGIGLLSGAASGATIYSFVDENGVAHFTNVPNDPRFEKVPGSEPPPPPPPARASGGIGDKQYAGEIARLAAGYGVDSALVKAVIKAESNYDHRAVSRAGAQGLMQLMPETSRLRNVANPFNPLQNLDGGIRHLKYLLSTFGDTRLALAAYNAGENAVRKYNGIPPFPETRNYVSTVLSHYGRYSGNGTAAPAPGPAAPPPEQIYTFVNRDGVKVFTNIPWKYQDSSDWRRERSQ